ncbi:MAG: hypothetical protein ICV70_01900 [Jiangellaceae bacterium]|nr:hypothetical protein [Jiangellaceae bacterium]
MVDGFGVVTSVLNEQPPVNGPWLPAQQPAVGVRATTPSAERPWYHGLLGGRDYEVVYDDAEGYPLLAFADGQWFDVATLTPRPISLRHALRRDPAWSGAVVQTVCLWMRAHPGEERSFELATELALAVGELARDADLVPG